MVTGTVKPSEVVNAYLTAYTSGDVDRATSLVTEDFSFRGPMHATASRRALGRIVAHVAQNARGHRVLRQWQDGDDVCTLYEFNVHTDANGAAVLVSEWNTVRDGLVASSLMVFDTGRFAAPAGEAAVVDPVCGMSVDPATAAAQRRYGQCDFYFCAETCAEAFDGNPDQYLAPESR